jgi:hypothetical protein
VGVLWLLLSCGDTEDCTLLSAVPDFTPSCDSAELVRYDGESRLAVGGIGGVLTLYLPEELEADTYGGMTGNPLLAILTLTTQGSEETAFGRTSTMTIARIGPTEAELRLSLDFDSGEVSGPLVVPVRVE